MSHHRPPRLYLVRAASYTLDCGQSSSSFLSRLLSTPPPSPRLPALAFQGHVTPVRSRGNRSLRYTLWILVGVWGLYMALSFLGTHFASLPNALFFGAGDFDHVPDFPTPIITKNWWGRPRWAVSIPPNSPFPLSLDEYRDIMTKCREAAHQIRNPAYDPNTDPVSKQIIGSDELDEYFVDVREAEKHGILPGFEGGRRRWGHHLRENFLVGEKGSWIRLPECRHTMTFVLESDDAGLGKTLMAMWTFYGLARKTGRHFFIDDTHWAYGRYTDVFGLPPVPECRPPPRHEMIPCPLQARHLVISTSTWKDALSGFMSNPALGWSNEDDGRRALFDLARIGYEALFQPHAEDKDYIQARTKRILEESQAVSSEGEEALPNSIVIGMHLRYGDSHPLEYQYQGSYIPLTIFTEKARELALQHNTITAIPLASTAVVHENHDAPRDQAVVVVASDDPTVYESAALRGIMRAQERIRLASKSTIQEANTNRQALSHFVGEAFGWEGGFYAAMFWNLGAGGKRGASNGERPEGTPSPETMRLRAYIGRGYMMDLKVMADASDYVICGVGSMGCRLLAVMMGWERSVDEGRWVNVDGNFPWSGLTW